MAKHTLSSLHKTSLEARSKFFRTATPEQIEEFTVPCWGEAHKDNPFQDYCMHCLHVKWGRMLKPLDGN